ncbi:NUDIX domain-containing protein [Myceligenerans pegani]|uniref:NUDIX hydrolase n=1 Tax=Myceligenerans pegani TaxID=2776917 RepID=A0ABR9MYK9_9MICO|nr:NUDIX hydrolase [Myceligenerans sp. TRM 65318]MBE1875948.1 NUDIX hydrolase [Myceligenerans sp. TRM 65318]MBE3018219.1 NUDIX hydrolase [Myceligenerans sp. TRM 65318]
MSAGAVVKVGRRGARGIVIDDEGRLVLIKRTKPGQDPYWTSPGGGVEESDATVEDALRRELAEELGATAGGYQQVFFASDPTDAGVAIQYFFLARLRSLNLTEQYGSEFSKPERGGYDLDYVPLTDDSLGAIDLKPVELKEFVLANREALLAEAGFTA